MFNERKRAKELMEEKILRAAERGARRSANAKLFGSGPVTTGLEGPGDLRDDGPRCLNYIGSSQKLACMHVFVKLMRQRTHAWQSCLKMNQLSAKSSADISHDWKVT